MGGQEGLRLSGKWVQPRGQIPVNNGLRRAPSPNTQARSVLRMSTHENGLLLFDGTRISVMEIVPNEL